MKDWHVGMKVVCVNDINSVRPPTHSGLLKNRIYTIRNFEPPPPFLDKAQLRVEESKGVYFCDRFRPVQPRKTDISIFTSLLLKVKEPA